MCFLLLYWLSASSLKPQRNQFKCKYSAFSLAGNQVQLLTVLSGEDPPYCAVSGDNTVYKDS